MLEYARWKYILVSVVLLFALILALPNVFGDDRALAAERVPLHQSPRASNQR